MTITAKRRLAGKRRLTSDLAQSPALRDSILERLVRHMSVSLLCIGMSGCNTLYFHSDADQKTMQEAQKAFALAKEEHLKMAGLSFEDLFKAQREAIIENELTYRDQAIVSALNNKDSLIKNNINERLMELVGKGNLNNIKQVNLVDLTDNINSQNKQISRTMREIAFEAKQLGYKIDNVDVVCSTLKSEPKTNAQAQQILQTCGSLRAQIGNLQNYEEKYFTFSGLIKPSPPGGGNNNGELGQSLNELGVINELIGQQQKTQSAMQATLKKAKDYYDCEANREKHPGIDDSIRDAASLLAAFLDPKNAALPAKPVGDELKGCPQNQEPWNIVFFQELAGLGVTPDNIKKLENAIAQTKPTLIAAITKAQTDFAKSNFGEILKGISTPDIQNSNPTASKEAIIASKSVQLLGYIQDYEQASSGQLPELPALQIGLARARLAAALADAELSNLKRKQELLNVKLNGQLTEANYLVEAEEKLAAGSRIPAIRRYGLALSQGHLFSEVASWDLNNLLLQSWLARYQVLVKANYEVLEPAMVQLSDYTAGGITSSDIAAFGHLLAMIAIAVGVN